MTTTPRLGVLMMATNMAQKEQVFNEAILAFDSLFSGTVISASVAAPPAAPNDGDCYIVPDGATGVWSGKTNKIAFAYNGWQFVTPPEQYRVYNVAESEFMKFTSSGGWSFMATDVPTVLADLTDVNTAGVTDGQLLKYDAGTLKWVPYTLVAPTTLHEMTDVEVTEGAGIDGKVLKFNAASGKWVAADEVIPPSTLLELTDVNAASIANNRVAKWNESTGKLEFVEPASLVILTSLSQVADVAYGSPGTLSVNDVLMWNGASWAPSSDAIHFTFENMEDGPGALTGAAGKVLIVNELETALEYADLAAFLATSGIKLVDMTDVDATEGAGIDGKFLKWDNTAGKWVPSAVPAALAVKHDGATVDAAVNTINFTGGVSVTEDSAGHISVDIHGNTPVAYQDHGTDVDQPAKINFAGLCTLAEADGVLTLTVDGVSAFTSLTDSNIVSPAAGDVLSYDAATSKWKNTPLSAAVALLPDTLSPSTYELGPYAPPSASMFATLVNAAGISHSVVEGRGFLTIPGTYGGYGVAFTGHTLVNNSVPWQVTARIVDNSGNVAGHYTGIAMRRSATGKVVYIAVSSNADTGTPNKINRIAFIYDDGSEHVVAAPITDYKWVRLGFDGTNIKASISADGMVWELLDSIDVATALGGTPNQCGVAHRCVTGVASNVGGLITYYDDPDYPWGARNTQGVAAFGLNELTNVDSTAPTDGQALVWDDASSKWIPGSVSGGSESLDGLTDVDVSEGPGINGYILQWDDAASKWTAVQAFYDVGSFCSGKPLALETVFQFSAVRSFELPGNASGSKAVATSAPTSVATFSIYKNGLNIGSMQFAAAATTPTFSTSGGDAVSFAVGDYLSVVAPAVQDATLADISFTFKGALTQE